MKKMLLAVALIAGILLGIHFAVKAAPTQQNESFVFSCAACRSLCVHSQNPSGCVASCHPPFCQF